MRFYGCCLRPPGVFMAVELMQISLAKVVHAEAPYGNGSGAPDGTGRRKQFDYTLSEMLRLCRDMAAGLAYLVSSHSQLN